MNRSEFLMALYDALNDIPAGERTEAVSEYQEYFKNEIEKGLTEEEICSSLGDPVALAYGIKQRRGYGQVTPNQAPPKARSPRVFKLLKTIISIVITVTIISTIGATLSFSKGFVWNNFNFGLGKKYDVNEEKDIDLGSASVITIRVLSSDTKVEVSGRNKVLASLKGTVRTTNEASLPKLEITRNGDNIVIEERRNLTSSIFSYSSNVKMDITIPENFKGEIKYEGTSGNLSASELDLESVSINLLSGDLKLDDITVEQSLKISSTSGNVNINKIKVNEVYLESQSGDKDLSDFTVGDTIRIESTSGNNSLKDIACNELYINSLSGDIRINDLKGGAHVDSTSGNTSISMKEVTDEINLNALSGNVELKMPSNTGFTLNCSVGSGDIDCDFDLKDQNTGKKSLSGKNGNGKIPININTTSGNIHVNKK